MQDGLGYLLTRRRQGVACTYACADCVLQLVYGAPWLPRVRPLLLTAGP